MHSRNFYRRLRIHQMQNPDLYLPEDHHEDAAPDNRHPSVFRDDEVAISPDADHETEDELLTKTTND